MQDDRQDHGADSAKPTDSPMTHPLPATDAREKALREAADLCAGIRQRIANGPMPEGARFDYEQAILALIGEARDDKEGRDG